MTQLQVALDVLTTEKALQIAGQCNGCVLEAGTPLIKSEGVRSISELRKRFPKATIIADMKTIETGALEVTLAAEAGADAVIVMAASAEETIHEAIKAAKELKVKIMIDLLNIKDKNKKIHEIKGADYFLIHTGIDEQKNGKTPIGEFRKIRNKTTAKLAVAGGINLRNIGEIMMLKPDIVIVGSAITKSSNIPKTVAEFQKKIK